MKTDVNSQVKAGKSVATTSVDDGLVSPADLDGGKLLNVKSRGWSMYPLVHHDDMLYIQKGTANSLRTGDIAFFRLDTGRFVAHRLVKREGMNFLLMNGDSFREFDEPVHQDQIFGKLIKIERNGRVLNLEGKINTVIGWLITQLALNRIPFQITLKQNLARVHWFLRGKRIA